MEPRYRPQRELPERLEILQRLAHVGYWEHDIAHAADWWSDQIYRMFGIEPGSLPPGPETVARFLTPEENRRVHQGYAAAVETGVLPNTVFRMTRADGVERRILVGGLVEYREDGSPERFVGIFQDVTDRVAAEEAARSAAERLARQEKLEAIGRLAGGVAHDFNNLLTVIMGNLALASSGIDPGSPAEEHIADALGAAERAASITRQLLAFARKRLVEPRIILADDCVAELEPLLRPLLGERIRLEILLDAQQARVHVDPGRLEQLVMNLAVNAREAMPEGGTLQIETSVDDGAWVLQVADSGPGIAPDVLPLVFEPFFTTKSASEGTGLGLATSLAIVDQAGGTLEAANRAAGGAQFTARFPLSEGEPSSPAQKPTGAATGKETVLVVEDEASVREVAVRSLRRLGYQVLAAASGEEALERFRIGAPDVIFSDVVLPDLDGRELAARIRAVRPAIPVLLTSGYSETEIVFSGELSAQAAFIAKPYTPSALASALRQLLDPASS